MKDYFEVTTPEGASIRFTAPGPGKRFSSMNIYVGTNAARANISVLTQDVISLCLIRRALEHQIAAMQPGLVDSLPPGDPNEFDAIKVSYEVDRLWNEGNK